MEFDADGALTARVRKRALLDHLLWAGADLDAAVADLEARSGVRALPGGSHPELGTRNAVARLGDGAYVEVIAPDPSLPQGAFGERLAGLAAPVLLMWAARTNDASALLARANASGYRAIVTEGSRSRPDGRVLRWKQVFVTGHGAGTLVPFFVEWGDAEHPSRDAALGLELVSFRIEGPVPQTLRMVLGALGVAVAVRKGPHERLVAELDTPKGPITLASAVSP
jgi:hypothetical protein